MVNERNAGRKPLPANKKMISKSIRFPPDMLEWIKNNGDEKVRTLIIAEMNKQKGH